MDYHQNARLTVHSREQMIRSVVEQGFTLKRAAARFNVSAKTAAKWVRRYRELGRAGCRTVVRGRIGYASRRRRSLWRVWRLCDGSVGRVFASRSRRG